MRSWRRTLGSLVQVGKADEFPLLVFHAAPPSSLPWPSGVARSVELEEFYAIADGAYLNHFNLASLAELPKVNADWRRWLSDYDERGDVLLPSRHVVWGSDAGGCPLVLDVATREVRTFQADGGDWEEGHASVDAFLSWLFNRTADSLWAESLQQLEDRIGTAG